VRRPYGLVSAPTCSGQRTLGGITGCIIAQARYLVKGVPSLAAQLVLHYAQKMYIMEDTAVDVRSTLPFSTGHKLVPAHTCT
jgi:hypothetical protein